MKTTFLLFATVLLASCQTVNYIGETHTYNADIEVFYNEADVERPYRTIGRLTHQPITGPVDENDQELMIERARRAGGDAIVFTNLGLQNDGDGGSDIVISAIVIQYK